MWQRGYVDGNGGNITVRVGDDRVLCTATLVSKGFMTATDLCLVDLAGRKIAGAREPTSEVRTHLGIMQRQPLARACVHAHPPHATAFAITGTRLPRRVIPEAEIFLGPIGFTPYRTPGSAENARVVGEAGVRHQCVLMQNHGVICWGADLEEAWWKLENIETFCETVWIASQMDRPIRRFSAAHLQELVAVRRRLGMPV